MAGLEGIVLERDGWFEVQTLDAYAMYGGFQEDKPIEYLRKKFYFGKDAARGFIQKTGKYLKDTIDEKIELIKNPRKFLYEMKELGKREGLPFMCYAIAVEVTEDVVIPAILFATGNPEYVPIIWAGHSEPVMYPLSKSRA